MGVDPFSGRTNLLVVYTESLNARQKLKLMINWSYICTSEICFSRIEIVQNSQQQKREPMFGVVISVF